MQIVINVPKNTYNRLKKRKETTLDLNIICEAVYKGKPLLKGYWARISDTFNRWCGRYRSDNAEKEDTDVKKNARQKVR